MEFRKIVYPSPLASYTVLDPDLIWIPKTKNQNTLDKLLNKFRLNPNSNNQKEEEDSIPAFFIPFINKHNYEGSNDLLIYYHANGEDLGICYELLIDL